MDRLSFRIHSPLKSQGQNSEFETVVLLHLSPFTFRMPNKKCPEPESRSRSPQRKTSVCTSVTWKPALLRQKSHNSTAFLAFVEPRQLRDPNERPLGYVTTHLPVQTTVTGWAGGGLLLVFAEQRETIDDRNPSRLHLASSQSQHLAELDN